MLFLGVNIAWNYYGYDFGNHQYDSAGGKLESWLEEIKNNGGNSARKFPIRNYRSYGGGGGGLKSSTFMVSGVSISLWLVLRTSRNLKPF